VGGNYLLLCSDCGLPTMDVRLLLFESGDSTLGRSMEVVQWKLSDQSKIGIS
jgi:hypothetical protein